MYLQDSYYLAQLSFRTHHKCYINCHPYAWQIFELGNFMREMGAHLLVSKIEKILKSQSPTILYSLWNPTTSVLNTVDLGWSLSCQQ